VCAMSRDERENTLDIKDTYEPCALPAQLFSSMGQSILLYSTSMESDLMFI
jgi:hypothetical protein